MGIISIVFISFLFFLYSVASNPSFTPIDNFLVNCGVSNPNPVKLEDSRVFKPDNTFSDLILSPYSNNFVSDSKISLSNYPNLYNSARILNETSTYTFKIKQIGRHFLRLHFYTVDHHLKSAVFSVLCNGFTLLHRFSYPRIGKFTPLLKEYVVYVGGDSELVLTLSPWSGSFAFINAIELISIPNGQFRFGVLPVPLGPVFEIGDYVAFETVYRINMGGPLITPKNDSLWRTWESDKPFLTNSASARSVNIDPSSINYPDGESVEIAPRWVYATAQQMADANVSEQNFNISWSFKVEPRFGYLIRMHFCDVISVDDAAAGNLIFNVYINKRAALNSFDISSKTNELSSAYFIDFLITNVSSNKIMVQVGPPKLRNTRPNAILNGLEIMKLSNPSNSLDSNLNNGLKSLRKKWILVAIFAFGVGFLVFALVIVSLCLFLRRPMKPKRFSTVWLYSDSKVSTRSFFSTSLGRVLSFSEIQQATNNFAENLVIGVGGFGKVYRGVLENGLAVAVKRGNPRSQQGITEFRTEITMLTKLRHRHLVSLIGYCEEQNEMILVYEFMSGGPLRKHLYGSKLFPPLTWKQRLEICIGAAKGLHYLHTGAAECIIHRDVKTSNILLDENFHAKVSDFGLSKLGPTPDQTHVSTAVKGSFGYLDPEYYRRQQLTEKSDVYSFGVVMLEVLCARPAINPSLPREQVNIAEWGKKNELEKIIDPRLIKCINLDSLRKFSETAQKCLVEYGVDRPTMGDVLWNLEYTLQLQESCIGSAKNSANFIPQVYELTVNVSEEEFDSANTKGVFSQLMNSNGR